ncbi:unnamed protein product [Rotaria socialis]|uniref:KA1 domain-containing protein n=1 Tax=Rotaria socialis TaxID=392032 RepID=A0A821R4I1_9BILA|nr:unnamed protein product [Rotaria socialis]
MFADSPDDSRRISEKKDHRIMTSNYFDDGLDVNNLDDLKIVSTLRYDKNVRQLFDCIERGFNTVKQIPTPKRIITNKAAKTWEIANGTLLNIHDSDQLCDWGQFLLQFSLDVVAVQDKELDIQRKRTKGYIWHYRRCYEDIIEKLNRLLPQLQASL